MRYRTAFASNKATSAPKHVRSQAGKSTGTVPSCLTGRLTWRVVVGYDTVARRCRYPGTEIGEFGETIGTVAGIGQANRLICIFAPCLFVFTFHVCYEQSFPFAWLQVK